MSEKIKDFRPIEPGELQLRAAFEQATIQNVNTIKDFSEATRKLVKKQDEEILRLRNIVLSQEGVITELRNQIAAIHQRIYDVNQRVSVLENPAD